MKEDKIDDIVIPILRGIQTELGGLKTDMNSLKSDMSMVKEAVRRIDARMASMDHHLAAFHAQQRWQNDEHDALRGRVEHIETTPPPDKPSK